MSVLKHEWIIMVEANSAHDIEQLYIGSDIFSFNTLKIVPLKNYQDVVSKLAWYFHLLLYFLYIYREPCYYNLIFFG